MQLCRALSIKKTSKHPHLEPPCCLVYAFMSDEEIIKNEKRRELHMREHINEIFKNVKEV